MTTNSPQLLTVQEVADRLSLSRTLTYALVLRGDIRSITIGRTRRISVDAVQEFVRRKEAAVSEGA